VGQLPADTFRRLYLLYVLGQFNNGSYGLMRLHKVTYACERHADLRPFDFKRYHYGQYSETLDGIKDQLLGMGNIGAVPLDTAQEYSLVMGGQSAAYVEGGNRLFIRDKTRLPIYGAIIEGISPGTLAIIHRAVQEYGYLSQPELLRKLYLLPEFAELPMGYEIFGSNLPAYVDVQLSNDDCADLALSLDPRAVTALSNLAKAVESSDFDLDQVPPLDLRALGA